MEEQSADRTRTGLGKHLRRHRSQGEAGIHQVPGERIGCPAGALQDPSEADLLGMGHPLLDGGEGAPLVEVGHGDVVPGAA